MSRSTIRIPWVMAAVMLVAASAWAAPYMSVNGANGDYLTVHYYIDEPTDSETVYVDFYPNEANVTKAQIWHNVSRRDRATLGDQDATSDPGPDPAGTNYFVATTMTAGEGGKWYASLPANKTGAYRLNCRYKVSGDANWRWAGVRDTAVVVSPKKARDVILYELQANVINASGDSEGTRSTFEDFLNPTNYANLNHFTSIGVNTLWIQPIHPIGDHYCVSSDPGSPYSIQNMWEVAPHHSRGNTRAASMVAFSNFAAAAKAQGLDFFFDTIFNHTSWDAEIGRDPANPNNPAGNPSAKIKDTLPQWYSRYVSTDLPCGEYSYNQSLFQYWLPATSSSQIGPAPAERSDFGKWPDVADLYWGTYPALSNPQTDTDSYWDPNATGADVKRMVEYFAYFGKYWIEKSGGALGGFRCDYAQGLPPQAWEYIINKTRQSKWDFIFMAESLDGGNVSKRAGRHVDIINQNWVWQVLGGGGNTSGMRGVIDGTKTDYGYAGIMRGLINHDQSAPADKWYTFSRYAVGAVVDGAPQMYQGQELGYTDHWGFSQFRNQFDRWIPNILIWHNMLTLWHNRDNVLQGAYSRVNKGRQRNIASRLHDQWYLNRTGGAGTHEQIFSVLKYEGSKYGWDPAHQNVVLSFVNLTPWTGQSGTFNLAEVTAIYLNPTRYYNIKNLCADDPDAYLWAAPGKTGQELINSGIYINMPADGNGNPETAFVQMLKLEEHGGGGGGDTSSVAWVGNTVHSPTNGAIESSSSITVYTESYPTNAAVSGDVVYTSNGGTTWTNKALVKGAVVGQNDSWTCNLGAFGACKTIQYAIVMRDANTNEEWDSNNDNDYFAYVNCPTVTLSNVNHTPGNGYITPSDGIVVYVETAPLFLAVTGAVAYQVNGGNWTNKGLTYGGAAGQALNRNWWTCNLGAYPACSTVRYAVVAFDAATNEFWANNNTADYWAYVNCYDLAITNPPTDTQVANGVTTYTLKGKAYGNLAGQLSWTNQATGATGVLATAASWSVADIPLATGANVIAVSGAYTSSAQETVAWDNPTNASYNSGWTNNSNGGSGLGAWALTAGANAGQFRATLADGTNMSVDAAGWGMWAHTDSASDAIRNFNSALAAGDSFSLRWDNNWVDDDPQGSVGFALQNSTNGNRFEFMFIGGGTNYVINDSTSSRHTGIPWTGDGLNITFALTGADAYRLTVGATILTGTLAHAGTSISKFKSWNWRSGSGWQYNLYLGDMRVTRASTGTTPISDSVTITREGNPDDPDIDGDGIPNDWETEHFLGPTNANAGAMAANGVNTVMETYIAGIDPNNPEAFWKVSPAGVPAVGLQVTWPSLTGRVYQLDRATDLVAGFSELDSNIEADPPVNTYHDATATNPTPYFYRVQAEIAP
ncbi:MAG TPA: alpha-amylase family glycosyl hydrolase [Kiritimatiellia bacterium]|nr:alpha-amylase family glycosyl hydrolase [Kiritimatiellia bacterium]HRZ12589.1 alpha-amylase family glycosyl hydrolase [Kiritimatiellia bacterium]HSA17667.1 alpha-amylase family glycosyl hydrolase [Kiritimatiellia bacterium]